MKKYPDGPIPDPAANLGPPRRRPPTAVGLDQAPPPADPDDDRPPRHFGTGLIGLLRRAEVAVFGARRSIGPRSGPTPTF